LVKNDFQGRIGIETYKILVEEIEAFLKHQSHRKNPTRQRNILCFLQKKSRQCEKNGKFKA